MTIEEHQIEVIEKEIAMLQSALKIHRLRKERDYLQIELQELLNLGTGDWAQQESHRRQTTKG